MSDYNLDEIEPVNEAPVEAETPKPKSKGKASGTVEVKLHWVQQNILNFAKRYPDQAITAKSVFEGNNLDNDHLQAILNRDLAPELNHFIRWLLKLDEKTRTEWQQ